MDKNKLGPREVRAFSMPDLRVADDGHGNIVEGHAAVFDQEYDMELYTEVIARGAFDNTDFSDVVFSINHDLKRIPLARSRNNSANSTLKLSVDDKGLYTRAILDTADNVEAKALYSSIKRGDMSGMSYIFRVRGEDWEGLDSDKPKRIITDISGVYEVTAATLPWNRGTDISARGQEVLENARLMVEIARARKRFDDTGDMDDKLEILRLKIALLL